MATGNYLKATRKFLRLADWLTAEHEPMIAQFKQLAQDLDNQVAEDGKVQERTAAQYGTTWNRLKKPVEKTAKKDDEPEDGLQFS